MPPPTVAIIAPGNMGAAVGARLVHHGAQVTTLLPGRGEASAQRASAAGMTPVDVEAIASADFVLSIVPPKEALALAERLAPALRRASRKPLYVDCNAVSPQTVKRIAAAIAYAGCLFVDAGIVGGPPHRSDGAGPRFYASGPESRRLERLTPYGLAVRVMDGSIGDASALKMAYAGLNKGMVALGSAMILAAERAGVAETFYAELGESQSNLLSSLSRGIPNMFQKADRWAPEMEEIADFTGTPAEAAIFQGMGALYRRLADNVENPGKEIDTLAGFFERVRGPKTA